MNKVLKTGLITGLLIAMLVLATSCLAPAATTDANGEVIEPSFWSQYGMIFFLVAIFAIFYFVMIRPQRKRQKEQQAIIAGLQKGDRVMTIGGIYGTIESLNDDSVVLKVEGGTTLRVARSAVNPRKEQTETIK
jgi:preprotein translocase subunit YajC